AVAADSKNEDARIGHQRLGLGGPEAFDPGVRLQSERANFPAVPGRTGAARLLDAALLFFVVLAGGRKVDAEQRRPHQRDHDRRADGAKDIPYGVGDRDRAEEGPTLLRINLPAACKRSEAHTTE